MAINYNNGAAGTLKPPILNGIEEINAPETGAKTLQIFARNELDIVTTDVMSFTGPATQFNSSVYWNTTALNGTWIYDDTLSITAVNLNINSSFPIEFNQAIIIQGFTTAEILAFSPAVEGTMVYCNTINQMVYYQVSPITGITLGWYNSTGTIKL